MPKLRRFIFAVCPKGDSVYDYDTVDCGRLFLYTNCWTVDNNRLSLSVADDFSVQRCQVVQKINAPNVKRKPPKNDTRNFEESIEGGQSLRQEENFKKEKCEHIKRNLLC